VLYGEGCNSFLTQKDLKMSSIEFMKMSNALIFQVFHCYSNLLKFQILFSKFGGTKAGIILKLGMKIIRDLPRIPLKKLGVSPFKVPDSQSRI
jgi:hypothetical protein